jgi:hypothetical protein
MFSSTPLFQAQPLRSSDVEQHLVSALRLRGHQLHHFMGLRTLRCGRLLVRGIAVDDLVAAFASNENTLRAPSGEHYLSPIANEKQIHTET